MLTLGFILVCCKGVGSCPFQNDRCGKQDCMGLEYDVREAVCCDKCLHPGAGLACCGKQSYDPAEATCCKEEHGLTVKVTPGLSQSISSCCGLTAYDTLNEICCESTVIAKPAGHAKCCGRVAFDEDTQLCCGRDGEKKVYTKSSDHRRYCEQDQNDTKTQCCCSGVDGLEIKPKGLKCCEKESATAPCGHNKTYNTQDHLCCKSTVVSKPTPRTKCCGNETYDTDTQLCCGLRGKKIRLRRESNHHQCCGTKQFNTKTQCCCWGVVGMEIKPKGTECCVESGSGETKEGKLDYQRSPAHSVSVTSTNSSLTKQSKRPTPRTKCCGNETYDTDTQLCCGPCEKKIRLRRESNHHECCGTKQFNTKTQCCCWGVVGMEIKPKGTECCLESGSGPTSWTKCCGNETYDTDTQLCCGPCEKKIRLRRESNHHECCGTKQFNTKTQCCCWGVVGMEIKPKGSECCVESGSGVHPQNYGSLNSSAKPHNGHQKECVEPRWCCTSGGPGVVMTYCPPLSHVCCGSGRRPSNDQFCGGTRVISPQSSALCCDQLLHKDREDGNKCQDSGVPHHSVTGTVCGSRFHGSPGQHCCGTELYQPHSEICCGGHRYRKVANVQCCGVKAYNIKNRQMKCCAGRLHTLPDQSAHEAQCCGSMLQRPSDVCCTSENMEVLYSPKPGFKCCGHLYFNTSLWSCCEGRLSLVQKPQQNHSKSIQESRLVSLNNLSEDDLCGEMHAGVVDSVSLHSIVFSSVVKLHGRNTTMEPLRATYILKKPDSCNFPRLIPGKTYFFTQVIVSIGSNHDSILESLYFIFSKCVTSQVPTN